MLITRGRDYMLKALWLTVPRWGVERLASGDAPFVRLCLGRVALMYVWRLEFPAAVPDA